MLAPETESSLRSTENCAIEQTSVQATTGDGRSATRWSSVTS